MARHIFIYIYIYIYMCMYINMCVKARRARNKKRTTPTRQRLKRGSKKSEKIMYRMYCIESHADLLLVIASGGHFGRYAPPPPRGRGWEHVAALSVVGPVTAASIGRNCL